MNERASQRPPVQMFTTFVSPRAFELVAEVLRSGWLNEGAVVKQFEAELSSVLGLQNPVAVNSGTAALHLALSLLDIGPGDEVILPAQTFIATGTVILMTGATPVFADIDSWTGNLSVASIKECITERTRAILPVHWGGYPCDLEEIHAVASAVGVSVIEDAAHALGARYRGKAIGSLSRFSAFSFQAIKHLTTGDGGALCCLDEQDAIRATARRWFGIDRTASSPSHLGARAFDVRELGYKYHMNNVAAAIGLGNLAAFSERLAERRRVAAQYREQLADVPGLALLRNSADREHAHWLFTVRVDRRSDFVRKLSERGIQASVVDLGIDRNSLFSPYRRDLPGQREFDEFQVSIPVHDGLTAEDFGRVVEAIRSGW